jgi:multiple sugar transport system permease protein
MSSETATTTDAVRAAQAAGTKRRRLLRQDRYAPYVFISPFYLLFAIFFLLPTGFALVLGFFRWRALGEPTYIGLMNYERLWGDTIFWRSVENTLFYAGTSLFVVAPLALLMALALNSKQLYFRTFWRAVYFAPIVTSTVAISLVFRLLYNKDYGLINGILELLGSQPVDWLGSTATSKIAVMGVVVWRWTGLLAVYFLAGLQTIPEELYEAAAIDGANGWQRFFDITLPMLRPVAFFVAVIVLIGSMQIFDDPQILTGGGPANSSLSVVQYLYTRGIERLEYGYASAVGLVLFVAIFVLSLLQFRFFRGFRSD